MSEYENNQLSEENEEIKETVEEATEATEEITETAEEINEAQENVEAAEEQESVEEPAEDAQEQAQEPKAEEIQEPKLEVKAPTRQKPRNMGARWAFGIAMFIIVAYISSRVGYYMAMDRKEPTPSRDSVSTTSPNGEGTFTPPTTTVALQQWESPEVPDGEGTYVYVNQKASPSVVSIVTEAISYNVFYGNYVESGAGSGVIISRSGNTYYIITNNHVVDGFNNIIVYTAGNTSEKGYTATVVGTDWTNDIAIIKIESEEELTLAEPASSASVLTGQSVAAIGNPLGKFSGTITPGIISSSSREVEIEGVNMELLQHSASVSPGNSGGGLFNMQGQLIGIVNAKSSGTGVEGIGFAIPVDTAIRVAGDIINKGYATGIPYLGISYNSSFVISAYQYNHELEASGQQTIKKNDVLTAIDGVSVSNAESIRSVLSRKNIGEKVKLKLARIVQSDGYRSYYETYEVEVVVHEYVPTATSMPVQ